MITGCNVALLERSVKSLLLSESNEISSAEDYLVVDVSKKRTLHVQILTSASTQKSLITKKKRGFHAVLVLKVKVVKLKASISIYSEKTTRVIDQCIAGGKQSV